MPYGAKEPQFFNPPFTVEQWLRSNWERGLGWYEGLFSEAGDAMAIGEASTHYTLHPDSSGTAARIAQAIPDARLIYVMRDPIERARSHYSHWVRHNHEHEPADVALRTRAMYLDASRYAMQLEKYLDHFPIEQVLLVVSEDLRQRRAEVLRVVHEFLGVDPTLSGSSDGEFNTASDARRPTSALKLVRRIPGRKAVARLVPAGIAEATKRRYLVKSVDPAVVRISDATVEELRASLRDDTARLRSYLGAEFHCWGIA